MTDEEMIEALKQKDMADLLNMYMLSLIEPDRKYQKMIEEEIERRE